jgi:hypothetical protein
MSWRPLDASALNGSKFVPKLPELWAGPKIGPRTFGTQMGYGVFASGSLWNQELGDKNLEQKLWGSPT